MKTLKQLCNGKPSAALRAMRDGIQEHDAAGGKIDMDDFLATYDNGLYICATTCALQKLKGKQITYEALGPDFMGSNAEFSEFWGSTPDDLGRFEMAMDYACEGSLGSLSRYMGANLPADLREHDLLITTEGWRAQLPELSRVIEKLEAAGF